MSSEKKVARSAIVLVVDRLGSGFLGPYGNTWIETPALNRLASEAILCENFVADASDLAQQYRSLWSGHHALDRTGIAVDHSLAALAEQAGIATSLVTDEPALADHPLAAGFGQHEAWRTAELTQAAGSLEETAIGQVVLAAAERWTTLAPGSLLWVHARGMAGGWDAPLELREQFRDEDDPPPYDLVHPPCWEVAADADPDELLSVMHAFAGHVTLVDRCLATLLLALQQHPHGGEVLLIFTSPRGYPLGEHRRVGSGGGEMYGEVLKVPLLVQRSDKQTEATRLQSLVQPADIFATLADWFGLPIAAPPRAGSLLQLAANHSGLPRQCAVSIGQGEAAVTTAAWFLRRAADGSRELFAKPDDRWEINEVADRCGDIPARLSALIDDFEQLINSDAAASFPELPKDLTEGLE